MLVQILFSLFKYTWPRDFLFLFSPVISANHSDESVHPELCRKFRVSRCQPGTLCHSFAFDAPQTPAVTADEPAVLGTKHTTWSLKSSLLPLSAHYQAPFSASLMLIFNLQMCITPPPVKCFPTAFMWRCRSVRCREGVRWVWPAAPSALGGVHSTSPYETVREDWRRDVWWGLLHHQFFRRHRGTQSMCISSCISSSFIIKTDFTMSWCWGVRQKQIIYFFLLLFIFVSM